jgi:hypothetical protein
MICRHGSAVTQASKVPPSHVITRLHVRDGSSSQIDALNIGNRRALRRDPRQHKKKTQQRYEHHADSDASSTPQTSSAAKAHASSASKRQPSPHLALPSPPNESANRDREEDNPVERNVLDNAASTELRGRAKSS